MKGQKRWTTVAGAFFVSVIIAGGCRGDPGLTSPVASRVKHAELPWETQVAIDSQNKAIDTYRRELRASAKAFRDSKNRLLGPRAARTTQRRCAVADSVLRASLVKSNAAAGRTISDIGAASIVRELLRGTPCSSEPRVHSIFGTTRFAAAPSDSSEWDAVETDSLRSDVITDAIEAYGMVGHPYSHSFYMGGMTSFEMSAFDSAATSMDSEYAYYNALGGGGGEDPPPQQSIFAQNNEIWEYVVGGCVVGTISSWEAIWTAARGAFFACPSPDLRVRVAAAAIAAGGAAVSACVTGAIAGYVLWVLFHAS